MALSIGSRIRNIRGTESRSSFAERFSIGTATLQRYESDERSPDIEFLSKLQIATGYSFDYLVYGKETELPTEENLVLSKFREAAPDIKNKILMLLLGGIDATENVVKNISNTGNSTQYNAKNQNINNAPVTKKKTSIKIGKQQGDIVNGDKHVNK
ncbi:helix-turn-helix transcriptional regulator [Acinetobacter sp. V102_4]|uniref:helix-turn-helix domain-containing protein n=1 Tax=Acinetobacter sp. V102_4 TaxID=3072984 RepID=UPI00287EB0EC|nr:helix-turn-helix transcriptional regulator [Acinetobacter sp. V102_4]MDS7929604.1 helix-turn-helix transcriptional regulator [Acinetobacter sp. V102_4]